MKKPKKKMQRARPKAIRKHDYPASGARMRDDDSGGVLIGFFAGLLPAIFTGRG